MEIKKYYIEVYSEAVLEEDEPSEHDESYVSSVMDSVSFYEKRFYLAHIKESTRKKYSTDELIVLSKENKSDETPCSDIILEEDEWIENVNESMVVCVHPETDEEVDGIEYLRDKGIFYFLAETWSMTYSKWSDE